MGQEAEEEEREKEWQASRDFPLFSRLSLVQLEYKVAGKNPALGNPTPNSSFPKQQERKDVGARESGVLCGGLDAFDVARDARGEGKRCGI